MLVFKNGLLKENGASGIPKWGPAFYFLLRKKCCSAGSLWRMVGLGVPLFLLAGSLYISQN
ncbi:hypothetical protein P872_20735 [Rhodonellum psychrophilum GCM71 = DSM 17998]|uniref:Uncharacterized protein n=1 Tax=Rhodonellum psychrophilum GCM71 = DSM 17998 TaxID=1123057 RepID=U5BYV7_9BACT|nr:hypothetical protein P872_20735 [Rhodonellum psychrophilum GCM71 = DSM 17998]